MSKWDSFRSTESRLHDDFEFPLVEYTGYTTTYNPSTGKSTTNSSVLGSAETEVVGPSSTTSSQDYFGTDSDISVVLRVKDSVSFLDQIVTYGEDSEHYSTAVLPGGETVVIQDKLTEEGSGFVAMPAIEQ